MEDNISTHSIDELIEIIGAYNQATEKLKASHELLQKEVVRLTKELESKNAQLARKNRLAMLGQMAANIAHEIRNPLGGIQLYASLLQRDVKEMPAQAALVTKIISGVKNLNMIVEDMLTFTRSITPTRQTVVLKAAIDAIIEYLKHEINQKDVSINNNVDADFTLKADATLMERVFINIVLNSIQAVEDEGIIEITSRNCRKDGTDYCVVSFVDNGPGIAPHIVDKIFDPFFTKKDKGTGLGLAIANKIVESHNGFIDVSNNDGGGARFDVCLPSQSQEIKDKHNE